MNKLNFLKIILSILVILMAFSISVFFFNNYKLAGQHKSISDKVARERYEKIVELVDNSVEPVLIDSFESIENGERVIKLVYAIKAPIKTSPVDGDILEYTETIKDNGD